MVENKFFPEIHGNFGFGCMRLPMQGKEVDHEQFIKMIDAFIASGLNYFDTAHGYSYCKMLVSKIWQKQISAYK